MLLCNKTRQIDPTIGCNMYNKSREGAYVDQVFAILSSKDSSIGSTTFFELPLQDFPLWACILPWDYNSQSGICIQLTGIPRRRSDKELELA